MVTLLRVVLTLLKAVYIFGHLKDLGEVLPKNKSFVQQFMAMKIVGGIRTDLSEFPHSVQFFNYGKFCAGTVLTKKTVLTAAHCLLHNTNTNEMRIVSGAKFTHDPRSKTHEVWDFVMHNEYNIPHLFCNDIAILFIHSEFGDEVKKAFLINTDIWMTEEEKEFIVSGWGKTKYEEDSNNINPLMKATMYYVEQTRCEEMNNMTHKLGPGIFCLFGDGKTDTCQGDSGGSVLWKKAVVGIVSYGKGCGVLPGMYVNVYHFRTWINSTIRELYKRYCNFHRNIDML